jgi:hypothetical protein
MRALVAGLLLAVSTPAGNASVYTLVCCGTTPTALPATPLVSRVGAVIVNQGPETICVGKTSALNVDGGLNPPSTTTGPCPDGIPIPSNGSLAENTGSNLPDYCVAKDAQSAGSGCTMIREIR